MKRLARYTILQAEVVFRYLLQDEGQALVVYSDSDWADCRRNRKSTSRGAVCWGSIV